MPKLIMVIMQEDYPFGQCQEVPNDDSKVVVRKIHPLLAQTRPSFLQKLCLLRGLKSQHLIKIDMVLQQEQSMHVLYEYTPIKLETWISNISDQFISNIMDQLIKFSSVLANNGIKTEFVLKNIGMDQKYRAKYFLGLGFQVDRKLHKEKLKSSYIREITGLFRPYVEGHGKKAQSELVREPEQKGQPHLASSIVSSRNKDNAISPPTNKPTTKEPSNKQQAISRYIQQANISIDSSNQKLVQEFMDVLDNDDQEEVKVNDRSNVVSGLDQQALVRPAAYVGVYSKRDSQHDSMDGSTKNSYQTLQRNNKSQTMQMQQNKPLVNQLALQRLPQCSYNASASNNPGESPRNIPSYQSVGRGKSEMKEPVRREQRDSDYLQVRVKTAIEKSLLAIKKFKSIRSNPVF